MAGDELFLNYGYCQHEGDPEWTDHIFMTGDFREAATLILQYQREKKGGIKYDNDGKLIVPDGTDKLVAGLLPETEKELTKLTEGVKDRSDLVKELAQHKSLEPQTPDWIRSNGMCLEHMVPRKSLLPQAGQGGFAQHRIHKGEMIVPAPLLQIIDRDALQLYDDDWNRIGTQLLINYCFAHPESSLLLCPDTNAVLINHCSLRTKVCGPNGPNAEYRWSSGWDKTSDAWRQKSLDEIAAEPGRGLAFEIVALRDIELGEEVYMDYGPDWEEAWAQHVANWKAPPPIDQYITAKEANEKEGPILDILVAGDLRKKAEHPYLFTGCQYYETDQDKHKVYKNKDPDWDKLTDDELLERFADDGSEYRYGRKGYTKHSDASHWPCSVLREEENGSYTVRVHQNPWEDSLPWDENDLPRILTNYPRESIHYFVQPLASDQHLPNAFRFPIGIRDDMFPDHWKNRPKKHS